MTSDKRIPIRQCSGLPSPHWVGVYGLMTVFFSSEAVARARRHDAIGSAGVACGSEKRNSDVLWFTRDVLTRRHSAHWKGDSNG